MSRLLREVGMSPAFFFALRSAVHFLRKKASMTAADNKTEQLISDILKLVDPVVLSEGMELVELEYRREPHGWVLRLFIDQEGGIIVDDCARISQVVGDLLDIADIIGNPYHLEVSSPGLNRPLRKQEHFLKVLEDTIEVRTTTPMGNRRKFKGILMEAGHETIRIDCDGQAFDIPLALVERARLCYFESLERRGQI